jgi:peptidoglycan/LPS O-acetylase OafA/YrhL
MKLEYRRDIDGMRALAVTAVIVFHAFPKICPGGFTGVDVFFVLSGYLITGIILADLSRGEFSFSNFYARRIRRIFPALVVVLAACLAMGWFVLFPHEWRGLAKGVLAGAGFYSNFLVAGMHGYFDPAAQNQPLLHLWSLGVEEQFYIFWPVTLVLLWKRPRWMPGGLLLLAGISFALNVAYMRIDPVQSFYNPATRMWELLAGASLAQFTLEHGEEKSRAAREALGAAGLALVAAGFWLIDETKAFPGWWALVPVIGTLMLVRAGPEAWFNRWALGSRPAVFVGLISYPLYLWHWPLLVFARMVNESDYRFDPHRAGQVHAATALLIVVLPWLTYKLWEAPIRFSTKRTAAFRVRLLLGSMAGIAVVALLSLETLPPRLNSPAARELAVVKADVTPSENWMLFPFRVREIPASGKKATLLVGDSYMAQYEPRIEADLRAEPRRATAVFASSGQCPPLPGMNLAKSGFRCPAFYDYWTGLAMQPRFSTVAISAAWWVYDLDTTRAYGASPQNAIMPLTYRGGRPTPQDFGEAWRGLETTIGTLVKAGKRVVLVGSSPTFETLNPEHGISRIHAQAVWRMPPVPKALVERLQAESNKKLIAIRARYRRRGSLADRLSLRGGQVPGARCGRLANLRRRQSRALVQGGHADDFYG